MKSMIRRGLIFFVILIGMFIGNKTVNASENIVLQMDMVGNRAMRVTGDTVIDLRGHDAEVYVESGHVEIRDTLGEGRLTTDLEYGLTVEEGATVVLEGVEIDRAEIHGNVTMTNCTSNSRMDFMDGSVVVIEDGNFNKIYTYVGSNTAIYSGYIGLIESQGKVDMYGGNMYRAKVQANTFTIEGGKFANGAVEIGNRGTFKMNGGNLDNTNVYPGGTFIMNKGNITNDKSPAVWLQYELNNVVINGGTINVKNASIFAFPCSNRTVTTGRTSSVTINGGTFIGDYIIAAYNTDSFKYGTLDFYAEENIFNIFITGGNFSTYNNTNIRKNEQAILIKDKMNVKISGGEFNVPVKVDGCSVNFSNAKFNKGLEIDNDLESSSNVIAANLKNCTVKDELRIEGYNSKYINITIDGGIYQEVTIQNGVNKGQTIIKSGAFSKDVHIGTMAATTINNGKFSGEMSIKADVTRINNGNFSGVDINSQSVTINGGTFYNKKKTPLHISVKSIKKLKFNGGSFKTGKKNCESVYISYTDKKKAKIKEKTVKSILKKNYCFGNGYVYTDDAQGTSTSKHIEVYGNAKVKKGKLNWAIKFYSMKLEKTPYSKEKKVPSYYVASVKSVKAGHKYGKLPKVKCKGYVFKGWYTKISGGKKVTKKTKYKLKNGSCLYAWFVKKK